VAGLELDQHVNVAIWPEVVAKHRPKERELADMVALAEACKPFSVNCDAASLHPSALFSGTMIPARGDGHVLNGPCYHTSDERLHRHVLQRGLHPKLAMDLLRQIDVNLSSPDARRRNSPPMTSGMFVRNGS
jgi:hypothetical protein